MGRELVRRKNEMSVGSGRGRGRGRRQTTGRRLHLCRTGYGPPLQQRSVGAGAGGVGVAEWRDLRSPVLAKPTLNIQNSSRGC